MDIIRTRIIELFIRLRYFKFNVETVRNDLDISISRIRELEQGKLVSYRKSKHVEQKSAKDIAKKYGIDINPVVKLIPFIEKFKKDFLSLSKD